MDTIARYLSAGSVPLVIAAALFCASALVHLFVVLAREDEVVEGPEPTRPDEAREALEVGYLERLLDPTPDVDTVAFGVGDLVAGAARTGRALGLNVSVISRDETVEGVPDDLATVLDALVTNVSRQPETRDVLLRSERFGPYVEVMVGPAGPVGDRGLGLQISRNLLREQGGDLLLRDTDQGAAFVARVPAQRERS